MPSPARRIGTRVSFLPLTRCPSGAFERRLDLHGLERKIARGLVGHQHRDLIDEFFEDLRRRTAVAQDGKLVLYERVPTMNKPGGGVVVMVLILLFSPS